MPDESNAKQTEQKARKDDGYIFAPANPRETGPPIGSPQIPLRPKPLRRPRGTSRK